MYPSTTIRSSNVNILLLEKEKQLKDINNLHHHNKLCPVKRNNKDLDKVYVQIMNLNIFINYCSKRNKTNLSMQLNLFYDKIDEYRYLSSEYYYDCFTK